MRPLAVQKGKGGRKRAAAPARPPRLVKWGVALVDDRRRPLFLVVFAASEEMARERLERRVRELIPQANDLQDLVLLDAWLKAFHEKGGRPYWMVAEGDRLPRWSPQEEK